MVISSCSKCSAYRSGEAEGGLGFPCGEGKKKKYQFLGESTPCLLSVCPTHHQSRDLVILEFVYSDSSVLLHPAVTSHRPAAPTASFLSLVIAARCRRWLGTPPICLWRRDRKECRVRSLKEVSRAALGYLHPFGYVGPTSNSSLLPANRLLRQDARACIADPGSVHLCSLGQVDLSDHDYCRACAADI